MLPTIASGNVASATAGAYEVANSCRFNDGDSPKMVKSSTAGNRTNWTFSAWFKRSGLGASQDIMASSDGSNNYCYLQINSDDKMRFLDYSSGNNCNKITNKLFRDTGAWMNVVLAVDTTDGTAEDRFKLYINGVRETSFATSANFTSSFATNMNVSGHSNAIGTNQSFNGQYWDGYMAEVVLIDATDYAATSFGEFDEDSPTIWKPIDVSGLTFGNNGFYLDFEASDNLGNDANGGTDLTETNLAATDQATDTPTNNFATLNSLYKSGVTFSEGNTQADNQTSDWTSALSTIGVTNGKWYAEFKVTDDAAGTTRNAFGVCDARDGTVIAENELGYQPTGAVGDSVGYVGNAANTIHKNDSNVSPSTDTYTINDIISVALDCDNGAVYFAKNGTWQNSGDPTSGATKTGAITITAGKTYLIGGTVYSSTYQVNYGNPTYANSSSVADANEYGAFEYAPPSGYYALCTKNLAEFG